MFRVGVLSNQLLHSLFQIHLWVVVGDPMLSLKVFLTILRSQTSRPQVAQTAMPMQFQKGFLLPRKGQHKHLRIEQRVRF